MTFDTRVVQLLCEGRCKQYRPNTWVPIYTPHLFSRFEQKVDHLCERWACETCGTERVWGTR